MAARLLPLELIDKCIGSRLWIIMKGDKVGIRQTISSLAGIRGSGTERENKRSRFRH